MTSRFYELGFTTDHRVEGRFSIADLVRPGKRCGIYILHFQNGQYYVGQAVDVSRRFVQHRINHTDIVQISFKRVPKKRLNEEERNIIWTLERSNVSLRNIMFMSTPTVETDLDNIMSLEQQSEWLQGTWSEEPIDDRIVDPILRARYTARYQRFRELPLAPTCIDILRTYVQAMIPVVRKGEVSFWSVSCWPSPHVFARINLNWQEVCALYLDQNDDLRVSLFTAESPFQSLSDKEIEALAARYPDGDGTDAFHEPGGQDQIHFDIPACDAIAFLSEPTVTQSMRMFNLRLMRKGPNVYGRYHSLDLADHLV